MKNATQDLLAALAEGRTNAAFAHEAQYADRSASSQQSIFRVLVLDVIHDPNIVTDEKIDFYRNVVGVANAQLAPFVPRNTIIGQRVGDGVGNMPPMFFFPFMPSHIAVPCKAGEHVWAFFEAPDVKKSNVGWWMWRVVELDHTDDVNHSHAPRNLDPTFFKGSSSKALADGETAPAYDFQNGVATEFDGERLPNPSSFSVEGDEKVYERLLTETDASKLTNYEAVPRYKKRPPDLALEGSNNTLIVLGTDRVGSASDLIPDETSGQVPSVPATDTVGTGAGAINIVVGRGQTEATSGARVTNSLQREELGKSLSERTLTEGDLDPINDRTTLGLYQRTLIDTNFGLSEFSLEFGVQDRVNGTASSQGSGDGGAVIKSDKVRVIARSDIEFVVTTFTRDEDGLMVLEPDPAKWAGVVIKSDGSIVFRPASNGLIKLGGDDADKAILCTKAPAVPPTGGNSPEARIAGVPPIISTMGGAVGTDTSGAGTSGQGTWATKVLIK